MSIRLLLFILVCCTYTFAQESQTVGTDSNSSKSDLKERRNEISIEFIGMIDGRFVPAYERTFGRHWSAKVGLGHKTKQGLINFSGINKEQLKTGDINYDGILTFLEGRYYLNEFVNGRASGFYFGLYMKYAGFQSNIGGTYISEEGNSFTFLFDTSIGVISSGLQLGYKLPLGRRFAVDFLIAGPGTARYSFDVKNKSDELPQEFWDDLNNALDELGILEIIDSDFDFTPSNRKSAFNTINFRYAVGLTFNF